LRIKRYQYGSFIVELILEYPSDLEIKLYMLINNINKDKDNIKPYLNIHNIGPNSPIFDDFNVNEQKNDNALSLPVYNVGSDSPIFGDYYYDRYIDKLDSKYSFWQFYNDSVYVASCSLRNVWYKPNILKNRFYIKNSREYIDIINLRNIIDRKEFIDLNKLNSLSCLNEYFIRKVTYEIKSFNMYIYPKNILTFFAYL
jgi:hypothetical protein